MNTRFTGQTSKVSSSNLNKASSSTAKPANRRKRSFDPAKIYAWLAVLFVIGIVPAINTVSFYFAVVALQMLASDNVVALANADTVEGAETILTDSLKKYENPTMNLFHKVKVDEQSAQLSVVLTGSGPTEVYRISKWQRLPQSKRPSQTGNESRNYTYRIQVTCWVEPAINLSKIPGLNQIPIIGKTHDITVTADARVEHVSALD